MYFYFLFKSLLIVHIQHKVFMPSEKGGTGATQNKEAVK